MSLAANRTLRRLLPFLRWWPQLDAQTVRADAWAGLTNALVVLPQGVAYALVAGLPPQYGIYTAIVPAIIAALFGSSWHLISGPTMALSIVVYATIAPLAETGSEAYVALVLTLTLLAGLYQLAFGLARLGALVNFVSPAVITGFTAGAAILIVTSQLRHLTGLDVPPGNEFTEVWRHVFAHIDEARPRVLAIAAISFAVAIGIRLVRPGWPYLLIAMIAGGLAGYGLDAAAHGVPVVGEIPSAIPQPSLPSFDPGHLRQLAPSALAIALLGLIEAISIGRAVAMRSSQRIDGNQEFIGQGLSNIVGAFASCYASSGSFTRSGINYDAGARTPLAGILSGPFLLGIVVIFAPLARWLPNAAMGGIIVLIAWNLIDFRRIRETLRASREDSAVLVVTFLATLLTDLAFAIVAGVLLSLFLFLKRAASPGVFSLAPDPEHPKRRFTNLRRKPLTECPQIKVIRIDGPLFFGSVQPLADTIARLAEGADGHRHLLIVCSAINYIDSAGAQLLVHEAARWRARGGGLYLCALRMEPHGFLERSGYADTFGREAIFDTKADAIAAIFRDLDADICRQCRARIFTECAQVPRPPREVRPIET
ncbi:MAG: SulP family inorganic anion transporter [Halofilum sp. (in: g-proteobacteria)]|nr:SulP family inorganic anion transporter [Halofilum sp. (in: g-proteobacteria)]